MPDPDAPRDGHRPSDDPRHEDGPPVVFEFTVPAARFVLTDTLASFPAVMFEFERLVPTNDTPLPYLWADEGPPSEVEASVAADPAVAAVGTVATFEEGALYRVDWAGEDEGLLGRLEAARGRSSLLQAEGRNGEWTMKLRFPSRGALADFRAFYRERGIDLRVVRLYDLDYPKLGQYNVSRKQREALVAALDMGHFEIPREATLAEVADALDISSKSLSERLRRGQTNLVSNSLTIGHPTGVGVGDR